MPICEYVICMDNLFLHGYVNKSHSLFLSVYMYVYIDPLPLNPKQEGPISWPEPAVGMPDQKLAPYAAPRSLLKRGSGCFGVVGGGVMGGDHI